MDSGASSHMTRNKELLTDYREFEKPEKVRLGDGRTVEAVGVGNVHVNMLFKVSEPKLSVVHRVLYVPKLACTLFSLRATLSSSVTQSAGFETEMESCQLDCEPTLMENSLVVLEQTNDTDLWHQRLGRLNVQQIKQIIQKELVTGVKISKVVKLSFCEGCVEGKMHRKPFKPVGEIRSTRKLQLIHSDVCTQNRLVDESTL